MHTRRAIMAFILAGASVMTALSLGNAAPDADKPKVRIGVYDNRAIAIAYAHSDAFRTTMKGWTDKHAQAKSSGDQKTVKQIETAMDRMQWLAHRQGFGRASVDDAMASVKDKLAEVAKKAKVSAIVCNPDFVDPTSIERVDVTLDVARLFNPNEQTMKMLDSMKDVEPIEVGFDFDD